MIPMSIGALLWLASAAVLLDAMKKGGANMKHSERQAQRAKVLRLARGLARSGLHEDHRSIVTELLHPTEGFADGYRCLTDRVISAQLDKLCAMAQSSPANPRSLAVFLADVRSGTAVR